MIVGMLLGLLLIAPVVLLYVIVLKSVDRYEPEPWWLLIACFLWGAFGSTFFAILGNEAGDVAVGMTLGIDTRSALAEATTASLVAPLVEESTKGVALLVLWALSAVWLRELDGALDGAIYGATIGLGFTLTEDVLYVGAAAAQSGVVGLGSVFLLRTVLAGLSHASFTAMTGLGVGIAAEARHPGLKLVAPIGGWTAAVALHFLHNFLVTFVFQEGAGLLAKLTLFWLFDSLILVLLFVLVLRDRAIVIRGLVDEVGKLLHPLEFRRTTGYAMLVPLYNAWSLWSAEQGYFKTRRKQLDLVKLAFLKRRRFAGESGAGIDQAERELRARIELANQAGVFIGRRP